MYIYCDEKMELDESNRPSSSDADAHAPGQFVLEAPAKPTGNDIPDGGLHAWMQVLGAFFLVFNSW